MHRMIRSQCTPVPDRQTDGHTDEHHGNRALKRSLAILPVNYKLFSVSCLYSVTSAPVHFTQGWKWKKEAQVWDLVPFSSPLTVMALRLICWNNNHSLFGSH